MTTHNQPDPTALSSIQKINAVRLPDDVKNALELDFITGRTTWQEFLSARFKAKFWQVLEGGGERSSNDTK